MLNKTYIASSWAQFTFKFKSPGSCNSEAHFIIIIIVFMQKKNKKKLKKMKKY